MAGEPLPKRAILIVNTASRAGNDSFEPAVSALEDAGLKLINSLAVDEPSRLDSVIADSVAKAPMVIVGGGDGTVSSAVDHFVGHDTVMGIIPLGTANSFARTAGVPLELDAAVHAIATGRRKRIDLGVINGDYFANTAIIGLSPLIADTIPQGLKRALGRAAYLVWACRTAVRFNPFRLTIETDSSRHRFWATEVRIANGRFFGGVEVVKTAAIDDGEIVIEAVTGRSKMHLAGSWLGALFKLGAHGGEIERFQGTSFRIETRPRLEVAIDGERACRTPIEVTVAPAAMDIVVPAIQPD